MNKSGSSPRKFSEKIALLNKKEVEGNAAFVKIITEVEQSTRVPSPTRASSSFAWPDCSQQRSPINYPKTLTLNLRHNQPVSAPQVTINDAQSSGGYYQSIQDPSAQQQQQQHILYCQSDCGGSGTPQYLDQHLQQVPPPQHRSQTHNPQDYRQQLHHQAKQHHDYQQIETELEQDSAFQQVPDIQIHTTNDDDQYSYLASPNERHSCSQLISPARSLPNIANLSVSNSSNTTYNAQLSTNHLDNTNYYSSNNSNAPDVQPTVCVQTHSVSYEHLAENTDPLEHQSHDQFVQNNQLHTQQVHTLDYLQQDSPNATWHQTVPSLPPPTVEIPVVSFDTEIVCNSDISNQFSPQTDQPITDICHKIPMVSPTSSPQVIHNQYSFFGQTDSNCQQQNYQLLNHHGTWTRAGSNIELSGWQGSQSLQTPRLSNYMSKSVETCHRQMVHLS